MKRCADHLPVTLLALALALAGVVAPAAAGDGSAAGDGYVNPAAKEYFTDVVLVNQDGEEMRLYSDLLAGKVVVINSLFTECPGSCPVMSRKYQAIQEHLGDRLGDEVHLISISVDPEHDTPQELKRFAERYGARPGWYLLTGEPANVEAALRKLGQWVEEREAHETVFLIGNDRTGLWKKAFGLAKTEEIVAVVDSVLDDPGAAAGGTG